DSDIIDEHRVGNISPVYNFMIAQNKLEHNLMFIWKCRGSRELRVAANGASIGAPVWKLRPPEGGTTTTTLISFLSFLSFCFFPSSSKKKRRMKSFGASALFVSLRKGGL
ncbi:hypothetical protein PIB30_113022, partial [Stylosanthes scabra]|nr:hypothetical protein [Stylosanthes scabra]